MNDASVAAHEARREESPAVTLALGAASREKADIFLDEQTRLVRLQASELAHEFTLRHWSLRVRHISDVMKLAFEFAVAAILIAIAVLISAALWSAAHDNGAVIEAFSVPPDMAARGITGEVVASKLLDRLSFMQAQTISTRAASSYAGNWGDDIKVQIPDTGISVGELNRFLHAWLGHQTRITGDIYRTSDGIAVVARAGDQTTPTFDGRDSDLDSLIDKAARAVYRVTQPYRYARFLTQSPMKYRGGSTDYSEALAILNGLTRIGSLEDRAWAYDGLAAALAAKGDFRDGTEMLRKSIAVEPGMDAYDTLGSLEFFLGHNEAELNADLSAIAAARQGNTFGLEPSAISLMTLVEKHDRADLQGDFTEAMVFGRSLHDILTPDNASNHPTGTYRSNALTCAGMHDAGCVEHESEAYSVAPLTLLEVDITLGHFAAASGELPAAHAWIDRVFRTAAVETIFEHRFILKDRALIAANAGSFADARHLIGATAVDCYDCLRVRGRIDDLARNYGAAAYWFSRAVAAGPDIPFAYADWGEMRLHKGDFAGAITKFREANLKGPHFADPLEMWGEALMGENRSGLALAKFEEANKYAPNWGRLHLEWGKALMYIGRKDSAKKEFDTASHLDLNAQDAAALARWRARA